MDITATVTRTTGVSACMAAIGVAAGVDITVMVAADTEAVDMLVGATAGLVDSAVTPEAAVAADSMVVVAVAAADTAKLN